jgi:hypothetical protein
MRFVMGELLESSILLILGAIFFIYLIIWLITGWYTFQIALVMGLLSSIAILLINWGLNRSKSLVSSIEFILSLTAIAYKLSFYRDIDRFDLEAGILPVQYDRCSRVGNTYFLHGKTLERLPINVVWHFPA